MRQVLSARFGKIFLPIFLAVPQLLFAQQSVMQFNVPYKCPDGYTYVVHRCEKGPKFEACFFSWARTMSDTTCDRKSRT
jgi:hypothetical protein